MLNEVCQIRRIYLTQPIISFGKERPIDPGTSEDSYQRNRNGHTAITGGAR